MNLDFEPLIFFAPSVKNKALQTALPLFEVHFSDSFLC